MRVFIIFDIFLTYPFSTENCVFERDVAVSFLVPVAEDASSGHESLQLRNKVNLEYMKN